MMVFSGDPEITRRTTQVGSDAGAVSSLRSTETESSSWLTTTRSA
jgi:hypothetical protein